MPLSFICLIHLLLLSFTGNDFEWVVFSRDRRDANRRRPGDEKYDPRTLYLPTDFVKNLTGGQVFDFFIRLVLALSIVSSNWLSDEFCLF